MKAYSSMSLRFLEIAFLSSRAGICRFATYAPKALDSFQISRSIPTLAFEVVLFIFLSRLA